MEKLMILDGNSIVNRAFYGIRLLTNSEGLYTNAVYGFLNILFKYMDEEKPDYLCVAFDLPAPTFRHVQYKEYKAQRKPMPEELAVQIPVLKEVLSAMRVNMLSLEGYEADDIIGTVARHCEEGDINCVILTGDRDGLQLATKNTKIKLVTTKAGSTGTTDFNADMVFEKYGITPNEFIDLKALMGDPSDNIPGVAGVGEKTASNLIKKYKSIEYIYQNLNELDVTAAVRNRLENGRDMAFLSKQLATIDVRTPIEFDFKKCAKSDYDNDRLLDIFKKLNFNSFIQRFQLEQSPKQIEFKNIPECDADKTFENAKKVGMLFYYIDGGSCAAATGENDIAIFDSANKNFASLLADGSIKKIGHDIKADLELGNIINSVYFDTLIAAYIASPSSSNYDLSALTSEHLGYIFDGTLKSAVLSIISLYEHFNRQIIECGQEKLFYEIEMPLVCVLSSMKQRGIAVDREKLADFSKSLQHKIDLLTKNIYFLSGCEFNINSPKQLGEVLFERLGLPAIKKTKTGYSTDAGVLEKLKGQHEIIDLLMQFRHIAKLKSTYADGLTAVINPKTGRIHSSFNQTVTVTGRISSTEPNLQNIPVRTEAGRQFRKVFKACDENFVLVDADYSQIELRILAHISKDKNMISAFENNIDIHTQTASQVFNVGLSEVTDEMRFRAKAVNFGIVYGIGDFSLSQDLGITRAEAKKYINNYLNTYQNVKQYMTDIVEKAKKDGFVTTLLNRRRYIPELKTGNFITRSYGERIALNTPIQGSAADIIKIAMVKVDARLRQETARSQLVLQVHDELIVEAHKDEVEVAKSILKSEMEGAISLSVPLMVDISVGNTWYDAK
ncbi:MAG: DNA polymerase I [Firmicutes bacterium]|nr:DNA polymerase I [Bacillota bacterium]